MPSVDIQAAVAVPASLRLIYETELAPSRYGEIFDDFDFSLASLPSPKDVHEFGEVDFLTETLSERIAEDIDDVADMFDCLADSESVPDCLPEESSVDQDVANIEDVAQIFDDFAVETLDIPSTEELLLSQTPCDNVVAASSPFTSEQVAVMKEFGLSVAAMKRVLEVAQPCKSVVSRTTPSSALFPVRHSLFGLDARIPCISVPKIDSYVTDFRSSATIVSPPRPHFQHVERISAPPSIHNPKTCDICNSDKSDTRKKILHRFREKRQRRNWKRGPRYSARSNVATARVRANGRFVSTCKWD